MSLVAEHIDDWRLVDLDLDLMLRQVEEPVFDSEGNPETEDDGDGNMIQKKSVILQMRTKYMLEQKRTVVGVSSFQESVGGKQYTFRFLTGPTSAMQWRCSGWVCTKDKLIEERSEIGEYTHQQIFEYYTKWARAPSGLFGG